MRFFALLATVLVSTFSAASAWARGSLLSSVRHAPEIGGDGSLVALLAVGACGALIWSAVVVAVCYISKDKGDEQTWTD